MKCLIIRFSSIGDLTQALSLPAKLRELDANAEIHFLTREDLGDVISNHPLIQKRWLLNRKAGVTGLFSLAKKLNLEKFTHIYDAHNNLRSNFLTIFIWWMSIFSKSPRILHKNHQRLKRFFLIRFQKNYFEQPFTGQRDLLRPLRKWGMNDNLPAPPQIFSSPNDDEFVKRTIVHTNFIALVPSAAYALKRWPIENFQSLIDQNPHLKFVVLAGPTDDFAKNLKGNNVLNLAGQLNLGQSLSAIKLARATVANDTGLMHFSEQLGKPTLAFLGPAPFGIPSRKSTTILERVLPCRPCSKHGQGPCVNSIFQLCLRDISPIEVSEHLKRILSE